jgi:hypothetical protein
LSRATVTRRHEDISRNLLNKLRYKAKECESFSLALDDSNGISDTALLLIAIRGVTEYFEVVEELTHLKVCMAR